MVDNNKGKGWHGDSKGHSEAAKKGVLDTTLRAAPKKPIGFYTITEDKEGNITLTHPWEDDDAFFQSEADKDAIYDLLRPSEIKELNEGLSVDIPEDQARASVIQEIFEARNSGHTRAEEFGIDYDALKQMEKEVGAKLESVEEEYNKSTYAGSRYIFEDNSEYLVFKSIDEAENRAVEQVEEDLKNEPSIFTQSWLQNFLYITDTDRRIMANEQADNDVENMDDNELLKESGLQEEWDDLDTQKTELEGQQELFSTADFESKNDALQEKMDALIEKAKEDVRSSKQDQIYDAMDDPLEYFVEQQGQYTAEDLLKQNFISIDTEKAAQDAVDEDGIAHFLASYDGNQIDLKNGMVMFRTN